MASTFTSDAVASTVQPRAGLGVCSITASYEISAALVVNDVIQMVKVPAGATVLNVILQTDDLDTNGSPAIVLDVGDGTNTDLYIDGSTIGQAGGIEYMNVNTALGNTYTSEDTIDILVQVAPATGATSGTLTLTVIYDMQAIY